MTSDAKNILNQVSRMQFQIANIRGLEKRLRALEAGGGAGDTGDHALLTHLDYARAGHTGFQAALGFTAVPNTRIVAGHPLSSDVTLSKGDVGLGNVDNTSDVEKPIGTATQTALDGKQAALGFTSENSANKDTDGTLAANSDIKYPSQKAVKTYVDAHSGTGMADYRTLNDGRLVRTSDTMLSWNGYAIGLWNGSTWAEVIPSSVPTLPNTATDLDGNALTYGANYDIYAQYSDATAFSLVAKKWSTDSTRAVVPILWHARYVYDLNNRGRLWLGTIRLRNDSEVAKFTDSVTQGFISNFYNLCPRSLLQVMSGNGWSYTSVTWRAANNDSANKIEVVLCQSQLISARARHNTFASSGYNTNAETGIGVDSTSMNSASPWASSGWNSPTLPAVEAVYIATLSPGYHYLCPLERSDMSLAAAFSSYGKGAIVVTYQG